MIPTMSLWQGDSKLRLLDEKYYTTDADHCPCVTHTKPEYSFGKFDTENEKDPGYHTNADGQIYLANKYQELMRERWGIYD